MLRRAENRTSAVPALIARGTPPTQLLGCRARQDLQRASDPCGYQKVRRVSGCAAVLVDEPAEHIDALNRARAGRDLVGRQRDLEIDPTVRAGDVVVSDVGGQHPLEMSTVPDQ